MEYSLSLLDPRYLAIKSHGSQQLRGDLPLRPPHRRCMQHGEILIAESYLELLFNRPIGVYGASLVDQVMNRAPVVKYDDGTPSDFEREHAAILIAPFPHPIHNLAEGRTVGLGCKDLYLLGIEALRRNLMRISQDR